MTQDDIPLYLQWCDIPHVKNVWFLPGYEKPEAIAEKVKGNGFDHPYFICVDDKPIGHIVCSDTYAFNKLSSKATSVYTKEHIGTFGMDIFIADSAYLDKGYGTAIVKAFSEHIFRYFFCKKIRIDPDINNKRAIRCYEKAGFHKTGTKSDGVVSLCQLLEHDALPTRSQESLYDFLIPIIQWAYTDSNIQSIGLCGSYARGHARDDSDIDLVILCKDATLLINNLDWINKFGTPLSHGVEHYGIATSIRVFYHDSYELEYTIVPESWADIPLDPGTKQVLADGHKILVDKTGLLKNAMSQLSWK